MPRKLLKIKQKKTTINEMVVCFQSILKMANMNYWLHPEFETITDYLNQYLKPTFPTFDWYVCVRDKTIKINV